MSGFEDHVEAEWQFDVDDLRPVEKWLHDLPASISATITTAEPEEHLDTYFDTEDWRIYRSGYALRLRRIGDHAELTLKALGAHTDGYIHRREVTQSVPDPEVDSVDHVAGMVGERVDAIRGTKKTAPLFTAITKRRRYRLWREGREIGELALDSTTFIGETFEEQSQLFRVEIETSVDQTDRVRPLAEALRDACCLRSASASKFSTGVSILGLTPPASVNLGATAFDRDSTISELAYAVLRQHFAALLQHEPGTRLGDDIEELHDMRVAARRLRAALSLFKAFYPSSFAEARSELRWVAAALGEVRDLDVQLVEIRRWQKELDPRDGLALEALIAELNRRRGSARERMLAVLDSDRYERLVTGFSSSLIAGPDSPDDRLAVNVAPDLVLQRYRKFLKRADRLRASSSDPEFHRVRIEAKRLRYALEFVRPLYGKWLRQFIAHLVTVQDVLGRHQDSIVAIEHLRDLSADASGSLGTATVFAMGRVAGRYADAAAESRVQFSKVYKHLSGKQKDRLERELRHRARRRSASVERSRETATPEAERSSGDKHEPEASRQEEL